MLKPLRKLTRFFFIIIIKNQRDNELISVYGLWKGVLLINCVLKRVHFFRIYIPKDCSRYFGEWIMVL